MNLSQFQNQQPAWDVTNMGRLASTRRFFQTSDPRGSGVGQVQSNNRAY
jgi:hypothetical protein